uniref:Selenoprotein W, 1 n=1 Tax=Cyprinus carpio carpio TaxID=630221 RepID=A0A8C1H6H2_CYPCA
YTRRWIQSRPTAAVRMTVKVHITYWYFTFTKLKALLEDEFPGELEITGEGTPSTTGWFEVEVNKKLVHSKKNGDGFVDSESKFKAVVTAIEQAIGK